MGEKAAGSQRKERTAVQKHKKITRIFLYTIFGFVHFIVVTAMILMVILWMRGMQLKTDLKYIPYSDKEFYFRGNKEYLEEMYENPYQDEKVELEFTCIKKKEIDGYYYPRWIMLHKNPTEEEKKQYDYWEMWNLETKNDTCLIAVKGGGLKRVYYFLPVKDTGTLSREGIQEEKDCQEKHIRKIRVVLDSLDSDEAEDADMICYYRVKLPEGDKYHYEKVVDYNSYKEYDVLIDGKEIPAYFLTTSNESEVTVSRYIKTRNYTKDSEIKEIYTRQY